MINWKSKYLENNIEESHVYLFTSLEIKNYIQKFLKSHDLILHNYQINFLDSTIDLFVSYYQTSRSITLIQKTNLNQKIRIKKKRFTKKLGIGNNNVTISSIENTPNFKKQIENYYFNGSNNSNFIDKKIRKSLRALEFLKLEYYSLKFLKDPNRILSKKKKKILFQYYSNYFKYRQYLSFLQSRKQTQKRLQILKYYKNYLNASYYKTLNNIKANSFIQKLVEGLTLFTNNRFTISLTLQQINRNIKFPKKNSQNLKRILSKLRKFQRNDFFNEGVNRLFNAVSQKNAAKLITEYIAYQLKFIKRHRFFFKFVTKALTLLLNQKFSHMKGIKLKIRGRINGSSRSKLTKINIGKISLISLDSKMDHAQSTSYGPNGTFGVQVWISQIKNH